jgi:hypothetical protein
MRRLVVLLFASLAAGDPDPKPEGERRRPVADTPDAAWTQFKAAAKRKDKERFWELLSRASQEMLEKMGDAMKKQENPEHDDLLEALGVSEEELEKMSAREVAVGMLLSRDREEQLADLERMTLKDVKVDGDRATGTRVDGDGKEEKAYFVKEGGEWKVDPAKEIEEDEKEAEAEERDGEK